MSAGPATLPLVSRWVAGTLLVLVFQIAAAQQPDRSPEVDTLRIDTSPQRLAHLFVVPGSDSLVLPGTGQHLVRGEDYQIDFRFGIVHLDSMFVRTTEERTILAFYHFLPFRFKDRYAKRELSLLPPSTGDSIRIAQPQSELDLEDIFGPDLQKSGSIVRGITVGSNRDFTVNSGLRLQLSGKITPDIDVAASLTDENTPLQPEGTTQTLQEFDKVFVELRGRQFDLTLGDFSIDFEGTEFGRLTRKLQGAKGSARFGSPTGISAGIVASGAVPRGKFHTNEFQGIESVQGPYQLSGRNNEQGIIVIAGTEKVFVNGEQVLRGETNDYTIDYSLAELTFTTRRLITSASRIVVDFEYTDRQYGRSFIAAEGNASFFGEVVDLGVSLFREGDDHDDPIDFVLTDESREILMEAGDNRNLAVTSGVTVVDSNGFYIRVDTLIVADSVSFYRYQPGLAARYVIAFSFVGAGLGEYDQVQPGVYLWKGANSGSYLPVRFLPLPQAHTVIDYRVRARPVEGLFLSGEFAQSSFDANTLSAVDDGDNEGMAYDLLARYTPEEFRLFGSSLGWVSGAAKQRYVGQRFTPIDRINEIEFTRRWGIDSLDNLDERLTEFSLSYLPLRWITLSGATGRFDRGDVQNSARYEAGVSINDSTLPRLRYSLEEIDSRDGTTRRNSDWLRQRASADYLTWGLVPSIRYEREERILSDIDSASLSPGSFRFQLIAPGMRIPRLGPLSLSGEYEWRFDDSVSSGTQMLGRQSTTQTQSYQVLLRGLPDFSTSFDVTLRSKDVLPEFEQDGSRDQRTVLVRNQTRYAPPEKWLDANAFYEVSTQQSAALQRLFIKVTPGTGNYRYLGDLNSNGVADEEEFELTRYDGDYVVISVPTAELLPVIDLKTSLRVALRPSRFGVSGGGWLLGVLSALSAETYIRIDEKSTEPDIEKIYFLNLSHFLQDSTTITGSQLFTQDIYLLDQSPSFSMRFRFQERTSLTRYSDGVENGYVREQSVRLRSQFVKELSQQFDFVRRLDEAQSVQSSRQDRSILSNSLIFDFSYRPEQDLELGFRFEVTGSIDHFPSQPTEADINSEGVHATYSFQGLGQVRGELTREETLVSGGSGIVPFELTAGRVPGKTWLWRVGFDYRVARFIQATVGYDGRAEGGRKTIHTARAEVQAFF